MKTTTPGSIGGMNVAIAWPNMWLSGSRFRNRSGKNGRAPLPVLEHLALDRDDVREHVAVRDDDALRLGGGAGGEDDLGDVVARDRRGGGCAAAAPRRSQSSSCSFQTGASTARRCASGGTSWPIERSAAPTTIRHDAREKIGRRAVVDRDDDDAARAGSPRTRRSTRAGSRSRRQPCRLCASPSACSRAAKPRAARADLAVRIARGCGSRRRSTRNSPRARERSSKKSMSVSRATSEL